MKSKFTLVIMLLAALITQTHAQNLFKDLVPGTNQGSQPKDFITVNGTLYFITVIDGSGSFQHRLWKSDGTPAGTVIVKDSIINTNVSDIIKLIEVDGTLFFAVNKNGSATTATKTELWKTDGTTAGTLLVDTLTNANPVNLTGDVPPPELDSSGQQIVLSNG